MIYEYIYTYVFITEYIHCFFDNVYQPKNGDMEFYVNYV